MAGVEQRRQRVIAMTGQHVTDQAWGILLHKAREAAERTLGGHFLLFGAHDVALGFPPKWNADPKTGKQAPLTFGKALNYRDDRIVGDIKYLWEPNRHLELVTLAQAWHLTREERYALAIRAANDGIWDWDLVAGTLYLSPRWYAILGRSDGSEFAGEQEPSFWLSVVHPGDVQRVRPPARPPSCTWSGTARSTIPTASCTAAWAAFTCRRQAG